jgi:hypothetical protein
MSVATIILIVEMQAERYISGDIIPSAAVAPRLCATTTRMQLFDHVQMTNVIRKIRQNYQKAAFATILRLMTSLFLRENLWMHLLFIIFLSFYYLCCSVA